MPALIRKTRAQGAALVTTLPAEVVRRLAIARPISASFTFIDGTLMGRLIAGSPATKALEHVLVNGLFWFAVERNAEMIENSVFHRGAQA